MTLTTTLDDAINYAAAFASGGMQQLRAAIRQKEEPMSESKFPNSLGLWKKGDGVYAGSGDFNGRRVYQAILTRNDRDTGPYALLWMRMEGDDHSAVVIAIWNTDGKLGNAKDLPGHFVNVYVNRPEDKKSPQGPDISVKFPEKERREPAMSAPSSAAADDDPFGL